VTRTTAESDKIEFVEPQRMVDMDTPLSIYFQPGFWRGARRARAEIGPTEGYEHLHNRALDDYVVLERAAEKERDLTQEPAYNRWRQRCADGNYSSSLSTLDS
jgi:hypothetical protein